MQMNKDLEVYLDLLEMAGGPLWTPDEITRLKALSDEGLSYREIAQEMGISLTRVNHGLEKYYPDRKKQNQIDWTPDEITQLKALSDEGLSYQEIAQRMGISLARVNHALVRYYPDREKQKEWTPDEITRLKTLKDQGLTAPQIAQQMGISLARVSDGLFKYYSDREKDITNAPKGITMNNAKDMVGMYRNGTTLTHLSQVYSITISNIAAWIKKYCQNNNIDLQQVRDEHKANKAIIRRQATKSITRPGEPGNLRSKGPGSRHMAGYTGKQYTRIDEDLEIYLDLLEMAKGPLWTPYPIKVTKYTRT